MTRSRVLTLEMMRRREVYVSNKDGSSSTLHFDSEAQSAF